MIRIDFDPAKIDGSSLFGKEDLKYDGLVIKLQDSGDSLSVYLREKLSPETQKQLTEYDDSKTLPESLCDALLDEFNQLLANLDLFDRKRFQRTAWTRDTLIKALAKQKMQGQEDITCRNRLLLEEAYSDEITRSRKAEWEAWSLLARAATEKVIAEWEEWKLKRGEWKKTQVGSPPEFKPTWDDDVWKGFRDWLLENVFHNKCAYCETAVTGFPGDAEHFRPKGQVRVILDDGNSDIVRVVDEDNEELTHPGYFWLAYHWQNILPSCEFCNRFGGKKDLFPVDKAHVAVKRLSIAEIDNLIYKITKSPTAADVFYLEPSDLDVYEGRLLLHPYYDNPEEHLYFKVDGAAAAWGGSKQGEISRKVFDLNQSGKVKARRREQRDGLKRYYSKLAAARDDEDETSAAKRAAQELRDEYYSSGRSYAVAVFDYIHHWLENSEIDPDALLGERRR
jgi:hypothetical protein